MLENGVCYLTYKEAAERLNTTNVYIAKWVHAGKLVGYSFGFGREKYVLESEIIAMGKLLPVENVQRQERDTLEAMVNSLVEKRIKQLFPNKVPA